MSPSDLIYLTEPRELRRPLMPPSVLPNSLLHSVSSLAAVSLRSEGASLIRISRGLIALFPCFFPFFRLSAWTASTARLVMEGLEGCRFSHGCGRSDQALEKSMSLAGTSERTLLTILMWSRIGRGVLITV